MARLSISGTETRTARIAVLTEPKIKKELDKLAAVQIKSLNSVINDALVEYLKQHQTDIDRYNSFFGEE